MKFHVVECRKFMCFFDEQNGFFTTLSYDAFFSNEDIGVQVNWFLENDDTYIPCENML